MENATHKSHLSGISGSNVNHLNSDNIDRLMELISSCAHVENAICVVKFSTTHQRIIKFTHGKKY
jgi:hypothetical protein